MFLEKIMNIKQLEKKAREVMPKWLQDEIDDIIEIMEAELESDPTSWGDWDFFEIFFNLLGDSDLADERCFKLAKTKVERHIGVQKLIDGSWEFDQRWQELITE